MFVDDVAVDFPKLKILLAHGGRPLWMDHAFFLLRRHPNVHLDISGIPPKALLKYFPRLHEISHKTLFGTDWPGPGVPDMEQNLEDFRALPLPIARDLLQFARSSPARPAAAGASSIQLQVQKNHSWTTKFFFSAASA